MKNGAIIGAVVGAIGSAAISGEVCAGHNGRSCVGPAVALTLVGTAIYAALGAGIDALIPGRTRIWPGTPTSAGLSFSVSPREHRAFIGWRF